MPRRRLPRAVLYVIVLLVLVEIGFPVVLALSRNSLLFHPAATPLPEDVPFPKRLHARVVRVVRPDGRRLAAYDVAPEGLAADAPVVLFLHGNAGNIAQRADVAAWFATTANVRLVMLDYSGYGGNDGSPSEDELYADSLAAYDHLAAEGVAPGRIVLFGESIGGAPALYVAGKRRVAGVAVQSTFASISSMAMHMYPWLPLASVLVRGSFPSADRIAALDVPILIVHGRNDRMVPCAEGERLHEAQPKSEFLCIEGADHNDLFDIAGDDYLRGLGDRFRKWTRP